MIRRKDAMSVIEKVNAQGGDGTVIHREILKPEEFMGHGRMFNVITLEPDCSIGLHTHQHEREVFYVLKGNITVTDNNDDEVVLYAGDALYTSHGESHTAANYGTYTAEMIALIINGDEVLK